MAVQWSSELNLHSNLHNNTNFYLSFNRTRRNFVHQKNQETKWLASVEGKMNCGWSPLQDDSTLETMLCLNFFKVLNSETIVTNFHLNDANDLYLALCNCNWSGYSITSEMKNCANSAEWGWIIYISYILSSIAKATLVAFLLYFSMNEHSSAQRNFIDVWKPISDWPYIHLNS